MLLLEVYKQDHHPETFDFINPNYIDNNLLYFELYRLVIYQLVLTLIFSNGWT